MTDLNLNFVNNPAINGREARYEVAVVKTQPVLKSWKLSLFSFEWLAKDGSIRSPQDLPVKEHEKLLKIQDLIKSKTPLERPVLGIGMLDNIEIGAGRDVFLTLAAQGVQSIEVHIPVSAKKEMKQFIL